MSRRFSVVIGNPPYQSQSSSKVHVLWRKFLQQARERSDYVSYIIPSSITSPGGLWKEVRSDIKSLNLNIDHHFQSVGSTFCYIVLNEYYKEKALVRTPEGEMSIDCKEYEYLPPIINEHNLSLYRLLQQKRIWQTTSEYHTSKKEEWHSEKGRIEVWHTNSQSFYTNKDHPNNHKIRVGVSMSGYPIFKVMNKTGGTQIIIWTECQSFEEANELCQHLNSEPIQEVLSVYKWSGWNNQKVISLL